MSFKANLALILQVHYFKNIALPHKARYALQVQVYQGGEGDKGQRVRMGEDRQLVCRSTREKAPPNPGNPSVGNVWSTTTPSAPASSTYSTRVVPLPCRASGQAGGQLRMAPLPLGLPLTRPVQPHSRVHPHIEPSLLAADPSRRTRRFQRSITVSLQSARRGGRSVAVLLGGIFIVVFWTVRVYSLRHGHRLPLRTLPAAGSTVVVSAEIQNEGGDAAGVDGVGPEAREELLRPRVVFLS